LFQAKSSKRTFSDFGGAALEDLFVVAFFPALESSSFWRFLAFIAATFGGKARLFSVAAMISFVFDNVDGKKMENVNRRQEVEKFKGPELRESLGRLFLRLMNHLQKIYQPPE
jgi:hypothetical protein